METLLKSSRYLKFIGERDRALEKIHVKTQHDVSKIIRKMLSDIENATLKLSVKSKRMSPAAISYIYDQMTLEIMSKTIYPVVNLITEMNQATYDISYWGEIEAIGRATKSWEPDSTPLNNKVNTPEQFEALRDRVWLALMKLRDQINSKFRLGIIKGRDHNQILEMVQSAFPKYVAYKKPPRELKPIAKDSLKEADRPFDDEDDSEDMQIVNTGIEDSATWDESVQNYKDANIAASRFAEEPEETTGRYAWDLENEMTDSFVSKVRAGQIEGAQQMGIEDFVWVAILDDKTDECCSSRNGMTTKEIEVALEDGKLDSDLCDATVPPAHFNCRCTLAPVGKVEDVEGPDWKSFNDWIDS